VVDLGFRVQVRYFAALRDVSGRSEEELDVPTAVRTVAEFLMWLQGVRPALRGQMGSVRCALNGEFASPDWVVSAGSELALLPPFSGG
jgi:sulfur-carrier protein